MNQTAPPPQIHPATSPVASRPSLPADAEHLLSLLGAVSVMPGNLEAKRFRIMSDLSCSLQADILITHTVNLANGSSKDSGAPKVHKRTTEHGWTQVKQISRDPKLKRLSAILTDLSRSLLAPENTSDTPQIISPFPGITILADNSRNRLKYYAIARLNESTPFSQTEQERIIFYLKTVTWLFSEPPYSILDEEVAQLTKRQKSVLILMLEGEERQRIADELGLSIHTVNSYIKELFRYFKVNSHLRLIQKLNHLDRNTPLLHSGKE